MNIPERPNQDALYQALNIYRDAMRPFILRNLKTVQGLSPEDRLQNEADIDIGNFPYLFRRYWNDVFVQCFDSDRDVRSAIGIITEARNRIAHSQTEDFAPEYALSRLHEIADILGQINAPEQKQAVETIRDKVLTAIAPTPEVKPKLPRRKAADLTSWREVIRPNTDVIEGTFRKSEFAADLQEVFEGRAKTPEYGETEIFFNQTYITPGLRELLVNTWKRLGGKGGNPVIQLKTGFGGGKTHSLIALYHLINGASILRDLPADDKYTRLSEEINEIMEAADWDPDIPLTAQVSVLVGTYLSTTDADETKQGDPLNTLWGMMAEQLGGQGAYNIIGDAARQGTAPGGNQLDRLFEHVGPAVILIDELVAYVRNVQGVTQESIYTFFQAVTESVNRSENITLVATLPEGQQAGGEGGLTALGTLEAILERVDAVSIPLEVNNAFEVVRRRLFDSVINETERDLTCEAFRKMYQNSRNEYPDGVNDQRYLQRLKDCYPIHPEIFDRLFQDWAVIPGFQRTRGVLRIMATCISRLYQEQDPSLLIMPANLTLDDPALADEFTRLLAKSGGNWDPVVQEVDSHGSRTDQIDGKFQSFIEVGNAARRIARTVFLGSATGGAVKGVTTRQIHLGVVEPGQGVAVYNDALNRMTGNLYFLYNLDDRYYFHTQENLNKVAIDRAAEYTDEDIYGEIVSRLERAIGRDPSVQVCPTAPSLVKDSETLQYVILPPQVSLPSREKETDTARDTALKILTSSVDDAERQRTFRNTLLFIAARRDDIRELRNLVKNYLAWNSIIGGNERHDALGKLEGARLDQTKGNLESADDAVATTLFKAYRWALTPLQTDPQKNVYDFSVAETKSDDGRIKRRFHDKFVDDEAIVTKIAPDIFAEKLQQYVWNSDAYQDHIEIDRLRELIAQNVYMPRIQDRNVLTTCIREGVAAGTFGYARAYRDSDYQHFYFEEQIGGLTNVEGSTAVLINPELAKLVKQEKPAPPDPPAPDIGPETEGTETDTGGELPQTKGPTLMVVTKTLQPELPFAEDIDTLQDEIVRTLQADGGNVTVEITVTAAKPDGFSENTARAVKQNSEHLNAEFKTD